MSSDSEKNVVAAGIDLVGSFETEKHKSTVELERNNNGYASNAKSQQNILSQYSEEVVMQMGRNYALKHGLDAELFAHGAALARAPQEYDTMSFLSQEEQNELYLEATNKWHVPTKLFQVITVGSMSAAILGIDSSVISGAILFYPDYMGVSKDNNKFGYDIDMIQGLINGAPYLCAACLGCWMTDFWNRHLGRKWTIFWACFISAITCFWQGFTNTWYHLFIARFMLGFGIGIKSSTTTPYTAECSPKQNRGALVMMWQFFVAVGIMFGYVAGLAFYHVGSHGIGGGLNWRLILGSACIPAIIILFLIPFVPESPRWLMGKNRHKDSFDSLCQLRLARIIAARDTFYQHVLLQEEKSYIGVSTWKRYVEMFTVRRNRNGTFAAWIILFLQQFCGVNAIVYYNSTIFVESGFSQVSGLIASWGFGMVNFVFAFPTFFLIDRYGRRKLLLISFPLMALFLLWTGFGFFAEEGSKTRIGIVASGVYIFAVIYSTGFGPIPFVYIAEAFPLYIRDIGMGCATAISWFFNFILALTWPKLVSSFGSTGAFCWYAGWNIVGFFLVLWFLPETKGLTLEELDEVFAVSARKHAKWQTRKLWKDIQWALFRRKTEPMEPLYDHQRRLAVTNPEWNDKPEILHVE